MSWGSNGGELSRHPLLSYRLRRGVRDHRHWRRSGRYILGGAPFRRFDPLGIVRLERLARPRGALPILVHGFFAALAAFVDFRGNRLRGLRESLRAPRNEERCQDRERAFHIGLPLRLSYDAFAVWATSDMRVRVGPEELIDLPRFPSWDWRVMAKHRGGFSVY